ncbi:hypothetical protein SAMN02745220_00585 [Desulfopila aestuarii DSM 18488]|uniref:Uncharacterized protein n=1 Tax=Desulfopila aestuarii DSM 18488 TaxID=1121416 RepID=A0A1M7XYG6_9BACT|nr:hypothetical protein SAMN02745220_00585 [Desulfopila aestuarii DSM 18488]
MFYTCFSQFQKGSSKFAQQVFHNETVSSAIISKLLLFHQKKVFVSYLNMSQHETKTFFVLS